MQKSLEMERITAIVGAGAILDFDLPEGVEKPCTQYITDEVAKLELVNPLTKQPITEIMDVYKVLINEYPENPNFEMVFHVLEMWNAYGCVWKDLMNPPSNPETFPVFAPFVRPRQCMDEGNLSEAMRGFILKVMDIIGSYNTPFSEDERNNLWYRDFWRGNKDCWDVFNLNYDTTIELSLSEYEDGFEDIPEQSNFKRFSPQKLWKNKKGLSTICHLHGCITFFDERYKREVYNEDVLNYDFHDMYKYSSYDIVRDMYSHSIKSLKSNQAGEQMLGTPIIIGLRKTDKLNVLPFDFYHGHLFKCLLNNNSMLLVGYSFGDVYINSVIERMGLIHGDKKRIVLIDFWNIDNEEENDNFTDNDQLNRHIRILMEQYVGGPNINRFLGEFLCRMTDRTSYQDAIHSFDKYDRSSPMVSNNGCLMLFIGGFRAASKYKKEIFRFLNNH